MKVHGPWIAWEPFAVVWMVLACKHNNIKSMVGFFRELFGTRISAIGLEIHGPLNDFWVLRPYIFQPIYDGVRKAMPAKWISETCISSIAKWCWVMAIELFFRMRIDDRRLAWCQLLSSNSFSIWNSEMDTLELELEYFAIASFRWLVLALENIKLAYRDNTREHTSFGVKYLNDF